jgi:hypothetical protein
MSARGEILAAIKFNRPSGQHILPVVPRFAVPGADADPIQAFGTNLVAMGGRLMERGQPRIRLRRYARAWQPPRLSAPQCLRCAAAMT